MRESGQTRKAGLGEERLGNLKNLRNRRDFPTKIRLEYRNREFFPGLFACFVDLIAFRGRSFILPPQKAG